MTRILAVAALLAAPTFAQAQTTYDIPGMQAGLSMLELNVERILDDHGFDNVDPATLDLSTIVGIIGVVSDDDGNNRRQRIEVLLP